MIGKLNRKMTTEKMNSNIRNHETASGFPHVVTPGEAENYKSQSKLSIDSRASIVYQMKQPTNVGFGIATTGLPSEVQLRELISESENDVKSESESKSTSVGENGLNDE